MLRIIDGKNGKPITYKVDSIGFFEPGMIATFTLINPIENIVGLCCGSNSIGIIDDQRNSQNDTTASNGKINIWNTDGMVIETDMFEPDGFSLNQLLFISKNGKFCTVYQISKHIKTKKLQKL